ncbi:DNA-binding transcriptional LysR family regulator [Bradyrhizobium sp. LM6.11]
MTARLPSLNGLRAFEAAARHLSFTLAASELNVTQTAISHQIRRLEEELGIRLFVRQNRALALTPEARDYLPGVRAAFNDLRLATDRLLRKDDDKVLTVSTLASLAAKWLLPRLTDFQEHHPGIDVRITTSTQPGRFSARQCRRRDPLRARPVAGLARRLADGGRAVSGVQPIFVARGQAAALSGGPQEPYAAAHLQRQ